MSDRPRPVPRTATVLTAEHLTPSMVRLVVGGPGLADFGPPVHADSYVKLLIGDRRRTYTVRAWDVDALELTLDIVVHGDSGLAGPWAQAARPGDEVQLFGPGGGYSPSLDADWHLLVGDESALPAIAVALERLGGQDVHAFVEVGGPADELDLPVTWVHRGSAPVGVRLVEAVTGSELPAGQVHAFVHGEAGFVKQLRRWLRVDRQVPLDQLSISGYWRIGADDEAWRAAKADWNREVEAAETAVAH